MPAEDLVNKGCVKAEEWDLTPHIPLQSLAYDCTIWKSMQPTQALENWLWNCVEGMFLLSAELYLEQQNEDDIFKHSSPIAPLELAIQAGRLHCSMSEDRFSWAEYCALLTATVKRNISVKLRFRKGLLLSPSTKSLWRRLQLPGSENWSRRSQWKRTGKVRLGNSGPRHEWGMTLTPRLDHSSRSSLQGWPRKEPSRAKRCISLQHTNFLALPKAPSVPLMENQGNCVP